MPNAPSAPPPVSQPTASDPTTAGAVATTHGGKGAGGNVTSSTTIGSLAELKAKAPKLYYEMMKSIAMNVCNQLQNAQDRLKKMWDEANRH